MSTFTRIVRILVLIVLAMAVGFWATNCKVSSKQADTKKETIVYHQPSSAYVNTQTKLYVDENGKYTYSSVLPESTVVSIVESSDKYYRVKYNNNDTDYYGWVDKNKLSYYRKELYYTELPLSLKQQDMVRELTHTFKLGIEPEAIYSLIFVESRFNPRATSSVGAMGLTQIMPTTFNYLHSSILKDFPNMSKVIKADPYDVNTNIILGMYYLKILKEKYAGIDRISDNPHQIYTMYNRGPGGAQAYYSHCKYWWTGYSCNVVDATEHLKKNGNWRTFKK